MAATPLMEILAGILRYFPNTMLTTLMVVGLLTARLNWIMIGVGGILLSIFVLTLQYIFLKSLNLGVIPGSAVIEACSLLPITGDAEFSSLPSIWMALTTFFASYILTNAVAIYTTPATKKSANSSIPVQQRKGLGIISIVAVLLMWLFLVIPRAITGCETVFGTILGVGLGAVAGWGWWQILYACFQSAWPDIHGVMLGTAPGALRSGPMACLPVQR